MLDQRSADAGSSPRRSTSATTLRLKTGTSNEGAFGASRQSAFRTPDLTPPQLPLVRLDLRFVMDEPALLPPFRGNMWRGVLGAALKRIDEGLLPGVPTGEIEPGSLYRTFFETPPPADGTMMRGYNAAPHPYVVDAPGQPHFRRVEAGAEERIGLTLVGRAATAAEAVLTAFDFAARAGLGAELNPGHGDRGRGHLASARTVWRADDRTETVFDGESFYAVDAAEPARPPAPGRVRVILATPLRIVSEGKTVKPRMFRPAHLFSNLIRRVSLMSAVHAGAPLDTDFRFLKSRWHELRAYRPMLAWADQKRWSGNQKRELPAGGIVGSFVLDMRGAEALFPYLWLGQWVHAGKGAALGLGAIRVRAADV